MVREFGEIVEVWMDELLEEVSASFEKWSGAGRETGSDSSSEERSSEGASESDILLDNSKEWSKLCSKRE